VPEGVPGVRAAERLGWPGVEVERIGLNLPGLPNHESCVKPGVVGVLGVFPGDTTSRLIPFAMIAADAIVYYIQLY